PAPDAKPLPPEPEISPTTEFTGALLRQIREARGVDLNAISQRTKIAANHLKAIEDESVKLMPAMVYVRGFLVEFARYLRLDVSRVLDTYLPRIRVVRTHEDDREG